MTEPSANDSTHPARSLGLADINIGMLRALSAVVLACLLVLAFAACNFGGGKPNCDKMRACCSALKGVENGLPKDQEILCHHNPELDEGCVDTISDIKRWTPEKNLPAICR